MFGFGKKTPAPALCRGNPGNGAEARVAFANGQRTWTENVDLVGIAADVFKRHAQAVANRASCLVHGASGFTILPQFVQLQPRKDGGVQTLTTMQVNHPRLVSAGVFEFQHSTGDNVADSIAKGFDQWLQTDFVTLLDSARPIAECCTTMVLEVPAKTGQSAKVRRMVLGPVAHYKQHSPKQSADEEHPFCPCCLLTRSWEAFRDLIEGDTFSCLRFFASRDQTGAPQADCRLNGEDFPPGAQALRAYASAWPPAGYEFRKQYVVLQTIERTPS